MGDVKLNSSGGGSVTLTPPSTASNYTVTLPAATATLIDTTSTQTLTNKTLTAAGSNSVEATSGPTSTQLAGQRNKIINGAMMIDQRNAGASVYLADGVYNLDRFQGSVSQASKISIQQSSTAPTGFKNSQVLTVSSAMTFGAGDYCGNAQSIEGYNVADLNFGSSSAASVILSFWVRSSITGTYSVTLHNGAFDRTCSKAYSINSTNTWEYKSVVFSGDTSGTWLTNNGIGIKTYFALGMGSTYGGATDGVWSSTPKLAVTGQTQWATNAGATFYITGVQLEKGATATPFENRLYGTELALCQRYYATSYPIGVSIQGLTNVTDGANFICINTSDTGNGGPLPVSMRATPTFATYSSNGGVGANSAREGASGANTTGITLAGGTTNNLPRLSKGSGLLPAGNVYTAHWTANAEL